jgi:hypothetical protein
MAELPKIISVDDHVVEPAHVWERYLPQRFKDAGPKVERRGIGHMAHIGGGVYEQAFDPDGPPADCWVFGDLVYIHKRHVAAVGYSRDEMTMTPMTYDEMRPGCYDPIERVKDQELNHVEASLCFPRSPGSAARPSPSTPTASSASPACRRTTTGWSRSGAATRTAP